MALPYAFDQAGWALSMIIFLFIGVVVYITFSLLFEVANKHE